MNRSHVRHLKPLGRVFVMALFVTPSARSAGAQSESRLKAFFEGKTVAVKIEMPGTAEGIDIFPGGPQDIDFPRYAGRLKRFGSAYRAGDQAVVTKIKVKEDLIEFQLGGGGYGTFGDEAGSYVGIPLTPKTTREKNLERDVEKAGNTAERKRMREELDALRRDREREDVRNQAAMAQAEQAREANVRQRRLAGGSRFNLRYTPSVPLEAVTPEGVMRALEPYLDFTSLAR